MIDLATNLSRRFDDEKPKFHSNLGSPIKEVYQGEFDDEGKFSVVKVGEINLYENIQSYKDSVDIDIILNRYACGDPMALEKVSGFFADVSALPNSYVGMFNLIEQTKEFFNNMPADFKEKFNNNFEEFIVSAEAMDFLPKISIQNEPEIQIDGGKIPLEPDTGKIKEVIANE